MTATIVDPRATMTCARCADPMTPEGVRVDGIRVHGCRRLCERCVTRSEKDDTLLDYPRITRTNAEVVADYELLRTARMGRREAAAQMGMTFDALDRALLRARAAGVPVTIGPR